MCWQCDNPQATEADYQAWLWDTIDRYGWAIQYVEPGRTAPSFAYTVGLSRYAEPELVVTGMRQERAGALLNKMAAHVLAVSTPWAGEHVQHEGDPLVEFVELSEPTAHLYMAVALFGPQIRALQVVYCDDRGHWPWHRGYRGGRGGQPVLGPRAGVSRDHR